MLVETGTGADRGTQLVAASAAGVEGDPSRMLTYKARSTRSIYVEDDVKGRAVVEAAIEIEHD
jgi:hypothetical protein